jgi:5'/3'-nucleotidase
VRILVTNDDGIETEGIRALSEALGEIGEVTVVAPLSEQSAVSRSITFRSPLRVKGRREPVPNSFAVTGTPSDCVFLALHHLLDHPPDLLVSGINTGPNMGDDILYSGTVAGAMEGALNGIPSVAISVGAHLNQRYDTAAQWLVSFLKEQNLELPAKTCLNINVPCRDFKELAGYKYTFQGHTHYAQKVVKRADPWGREYYWLGGEVPAGKPDEGSDIKAVTEGFVSITPLGLDLTNHSYLTEGAKA